MPRQNRTIRLPVWSSCILILASCSDNTGVTERPEITDFSGATTSISLAKGSSNSILFSVERTTLLTDTVELAIEGVPSGVNASFAPVKLDRTAQLSLLTITVLPSAQAGRYTLQARASAPQTQARTFPVTLDITTPTIDVEPLTPLTVVQGESVSSTVRVSRGGGYAGEIGLVLANLPAGVTGTITPIRLANPETEALLTLTATLVAPPSTSTATVSASGQFVESRVRPLEVSVALSPTPAVLLSMSSGIPVTPGASGQSTVTIGRSGGYAGQVELSVEGLPEGVTATIDPSATSGNSAVITLSTTEEAPLGITQLTVRAKGNGIADATVPLFLVVNPAPAINLLLSSPAQSIVRGAAAANLLTLQRIGGHNAATNLAVTGLPDGVTLSLPAGIPASSSGSSLIQFTTTVAAETAPGVYVITIVGSSQGVSNAQAVFTLTVTE